MQQTLYCCEAFEDAILIDPLKRFSSLPLFIRFGMLRNFFMPAKRPPIGWPFLLPLQLQLSLRG